MAEPAPTCIAALRQLTELHPDRSTAADGIMGDAAHQARVSDHNDGNAFDASHDPAHGFDSYIQADLLRVRCKAGFEHRVKYIISHGRIASSIEDWAWRRYNGENQHDHHMHVSIHATARNDCSPWWTAPPGSHGTSAPLTPPTTAPTTGDDDMTADECRKVVREELAKLYGSSPTDTDPTHISLADLNRKLNDILAAVKK